MTPHTLSEIWMAVPPERRRRLIALLSQVTARLVTVLPTKEEKLYDPRSRGLSEHGVFSCEECDIPAHMQGWEDRWEEDFGTKGQRWVVTRDSAWGCEHDGYNIAVFTRTLLSTLHSHRDKITSSDAKIVWFNLTP